MSVPDDPKARYDNRVGTLSDDDIRAMIDDKRLIVDDVTQESIKQACYELRASDTYYLPPDHEPHRVADGESIIVRPKDLIVIITRESLELPNDMLGRVLTKGQLFSLGLSSVNTYADPGFDGRLGIVFFNTSTKYIKIPPGVPIAKIEFSKLERPVGKPYKGAHGYKTKLWPIMTEYYLKPHEVAELRRQKKIETSMESLERAYGTDFGLIATKLVKWYRILFLSMIAYMVCTIALITLNVTGVFSSQLLNLLVGVASSVIASGIMIFATSRR